jgi:hypothetical protein
MKTLPTAIGKRRKEEDETDIKEEERIKKDGFCRQLKYGGTQKKPEPDVVYKMVSCFCFYIQ